MQIDLFFLFWLAIVILPIALAPVFIVLLENREDSSNSNFFL